MKRAILIFALPAAAWLSAAAPAAAADIGWYGLEVRGGAVFAADWDTGWAVGVAADLGELAPGLRLYPGIGYSQAETSDSERFFGTTFRIDREITSFEAGAEVRWFPSRGDSGWYFGGGPYLHRLEYEVAAAVGGFIVVAEVEDDVLGFQGVAGYSIGGRFGVEARYDTVSDFDGFRLMGAVRFGG
jgi:hypothetical protein